MTQKKITQQDYDRNLKDWEEAVSLRDERIRQLKARVAVLEREVEYRELRLGVLEPLAKLMLIRADLPGKNEELLKTLADFLPEFQAAVERMKTPSGIRETLDAIQASEEFSQEEQNLLEKLLARFGKGKTTT